MFELARNFFKRNKSKVEYLAHIDDKGKIIAQITRAQAHDGSKKLHPVIHVHIFNDKDEILLQMRSINKTIQPGKWDTAVGGHVSFGEPIEKAVERETKEELGLSNLKYEFITKYIWNSDIESEMVFVFKAKIENIKFKPNKEVDKVKFWTIDEIRSNINKNVFTPNFEVEYAQFLQKFTK